MAKKWEKRTFAIRDLIDKELLLILKNDKTIGSFYKILDNILKELNIRIVSLKGRQELSLYCNKDVDGYGAITYLWFYINELISSHYISFVKLPDIKEEIELGESNEITMMGVIPETISTFIKTNCNLIINPLFKDYIKANHQSFELHEAKKSRHIAFWSFLIATISALLSAISLFSR